MAQDIPSIGELEIQVLRTVWEQEPCTERQVWDLIRQERPAGRTTVLKAIQRLEAKGLLVRVKDSSPVQFRASVDERRVLPELVGRFVERILGGSADPLVSYLAESNELSAKDFAALKAIAKKMNKLPDESK